MIPSRETTTSDEQPRRPATIMLYFALAPSPPKCIAFEVVIGMVPRVPPSTMSIGKRLLKWSSMYALKPPGYSIYPRRRQYFLRWLRCQGSSRLTGLSSLRRTIDTSPRSRRDVSESDGSETHPGQSGLQTGGAGRQASDSLTPMRWKVSSPPPGAQTPSVGVFHSSS